jgi:hypothetical protein
MKFPGLGFENFFIWLIRTKVMYSPGLRSEVGFERMCSVYQQLTNFV